MATLVFVTSLGLSYLFSRNVEPTSVMDRVVTEQEVPMPETMPTVEIPVAPVTEAPAAPEQGGTPAE
jgi:hypothetical protein